MANWNEFREHSVKSGLGTACCVMLPNEDKYHIFSATESLPAVFGTPNNLEYSTTTNMSVTNVPGKNTTESIEFNIPYNLDNISLCNKVAGVKCKWAYIDLDDFSGQEFVAEARYHMAEVGTDSIKTIVVNLSVSSAEPTITKDLYDCYQDTVTFEDTIPPVIRITGTGTKDIKIVTEPSTATFEISSSSKSIASVPETLTGNTLTITGASEGSCIVKIVAKANDYASNEREIKVIVE